MCKRKWVDWDSIEPLYRAGALTLNDICGQYEADHIHSQVWKVTVTHAAIIKKAKANKWTRNLAEKVRQRVKERLVTEPVTLCNQTDQEIIEAASGETVVVARGQRHRTQVALDFQDKLLQELKDQFKADKKASLQSKKPVEILSKVRVFKDLAFTMKTLQDQQAEQYHLNDTDQDKETQDIIVTLGSDGD